MVIGWVAVLGIDAQSPGEARHPRRQGDRRSRLRVRDYGLIGDLQP